jgi:hypothetical protein
MSVLGQSRLPVGFWCKADVRCSASACEPSAEVPKRAPEGNVGRHHDEDFAVMQESPSGRMHVITTLNKIAYMPSRNDAV